MAILFDCRQGRYNDSAVIVPDPVTVLWHAQGVPGSVRARGGGEGEGEQPGALPEVPGL
jgi:hypothetical protein